MGSRGFSLLVGCLLACLFVAGCGGSDGDSTASSPAEKKALVKQGEAICAKAQKQQSENFAAYAKEGGAKKGQSEEEALEELVTTVALPPIEVQIEGLSALAEENDSAELEEIVEAMEQALEEAAADPLSIGAESKDNPFDAADDLSTSFGFKVCTNSA